MDAFSYKNIFDTKGVEYLIIIGFLILLVPFVFLLNRKKRNLNRRTLTPVAGSLESSLPRGLLLNRNHTWVHLARSGQASVGFDSLVSRLIGDLSISFLKSTGDSIQRGEPIVEFNQGAKRLVLTSPLTGTITDINNILLHEGEWACEDPYGQGWLYQVYPDNWMGETSHCLLADTAARWLVGEVNRFRDFMSARLHLFYTGMGNSVLQDGGELRNRLLSDLPAHLWLEIQDEFMKG